MTKLKKAFLSLLLLGSVISFSSCSSFFGTSEVNNGIENVQTSLDDDGNTVVTITFTSEDVPPVTFTIPKGSDGADGNGIKDIHTEYQETQNRVMIEISFTDPTMENYVTYIPIYSGTDGRGIESIDVELLESGDTLLTINYTDGSSPTNLTLPGGKDGNGISSIDTSYDPISGDVIVTVSFTGDLEPVEFRIPRGNQGTSIDHIETSQDDENYNLTIYYDDGTYETVSFSKDQPTQWLSGNTVPDSSLGNDGDFYINFAEADIYKKVSGEWVFQMHLTGGGSSGSEEKHYYYVTLELNGGQLVNPLEPLSYKVEEGESIDLPLCEKEGFEFIGWYSDLEMDPNTAHITDITPIFKDMVIYAQYQEI